MDTRIEQDRRGDDRHGQLQWNQATEERMQRARAAHAKEMDERFANESARDGFARLDRAAEVFLQGLFPAFTDLGGYSLAYYDEQGSCLCGDCAREEYIRDGMTFKSQIEEEGCSVCEDCGGVIFNEGVIFDDDDGEPDLDEPTEPIGEEAFENSYLGGGGSPDLDNL